jgi:hypothetical protein
LQNELGNDEGAKVLANYLAFERVPLTEKVCLCTGSFPQSLQAVLALPGALVWPRFDVLENTLADFLTYHPKTFFGSLVEPDCDSFVSASSILKSSKTRDESLRGVTGTKVPQDYRRWCVRERMRHGR